MFRCISNSEPFHCSRVTRNFFPVFFGNQIAQFLFIHSHSEIGGFDWIKYLSSSHLWSSKNLKSIARIRNRTFSVTSSSVTGTEDFWFFRIFPSRCILLNFVLTKSWVFHFCVMSILIKKLESNSLILSRGNRPECSTIATTIFTRFHHVIAIHCLNGISSYTS